MDTPIAQNRLAMVNRFSSTLLQLIRLIKQKPSPGTKLPYPKLRNSILDIMAEGRRKNIINLLLEADVTLLRYNLARHRAETGEQLSLTANIAKKLACTIDDDRSMHGISHSRGEEFWMKEETVSRIETSLGFSRAACTEWIRSRMNAYVEAFSGSNKLVWVGGIGAFKIFGYSGMADELMRYAWSLGIGNRGGIIERYNSLANDPASGQFVNEEGYMMLDETVTPIAQPGVSMLPISCGYVGSAMSITCRPRFQVATYA